MTNVGSPENCIEIVRPFVDELEAQGIDNVQIMGGIASAALKHPDTVILPDERRIVTSQDFVHGGNGELNGDLARYRKNGTLRDLDALVLSHEPEDLSRAEETAKRTIGDQLEISLFPLHDGAELGHYLEHPLGFKSLKTFVSDRYVMQDGSIRKVLPPLFAAEVDPETLEDWHMEVDGEEFKVINPATAVMNYMTRSISGLRPKDAEKVQDMARHIFAKAPELVEYMLKGPLSSQMELAGILQTLRRGNTWPQSKRTLTVGGAIDITAGSVRALREHETFMLREADSDTQDAALAIAIVKARGLAWGESSEKLVGLYQRFAEKPLDFITKNT